MRIVPTLLCFILIAGCVSAGNNYSELNQARNQNDRITVGTVQREIKNGMSSAAVVEALGSPNMVSTDAKGREVWVYDKVYTENVYSRGSSGASILILGASKSTGASQTSQKTLTIIVKFDNSSKVRDFSYRTTSF